jgi:hypothetical protein
MINQPNEAVVLEAFDQVVEVLLSCLSAGMKLGRVEKRNTHLSFLFWREGNER